MIADLRKKKGAYYTPERVAASLVRWVIRRPTDCLLDPACGDGRFLVRHRRSVGVEQDREALREASANAPWATIHEDDFFTWARETSERFECAAGNPPFIRYQRWQGELRQRALALCDQLGVRFTALTSSWAPFLVVTASLLKPRGRMAFVVPAEIGHAPYAVPLLRYLTRSFSIVHVVMVRQKMFANLSEDCWLLYAEGFGASCTNLRITLRDDFSFTDRPPADFERVSLPEWQSWQSRLRPFLLPCRIRSLYRNLADGVATTRLGDVARVGIGYVTGANHFFHLRPSDAAEARIPNAFLHPSVRNGRTLTQAAITHATVRRWLNENKPVLLLKIEEEQTLPSAVVQYLDTPEGREARLAYKCRMREPWYVVPDVRVPDAFLSYMSGNGVALVANHAKCVCTNSVHAVRMKNGTSVEALRRAWNTPLTRLSCELEGHPLGGGILKLEPREAASVVLPKSRARTSCDQRLLNEGIDVMKRWRHYG